MRAILIKILLIIACSILFTEAVFASSSFFETYISVEPKKIEFLGGENGGQFGAVLASGDFNGDNISDLAVGAPFSSSSEKDFNGSVNVIFGKTDFNDEKIDFSQISSDISIFGEFSGDQLGSSLSVADYNNDGYDDLAIGAYNAYFEGSRPGKVYIFYGKSQWGSQSIDLTFSKPSMELRGRSTGDDFGLSIFSIDVNNDRIDDLLIGAPFVSTINAQNSGVVYGYNGSEKGLSNSVDFIFHGRNRGERFGSEISGGDINSDNITDIVIGAYLSNVNSADDVGRVYIYSGANGFSSLLEEPTFTLEGRASNNWFGFSIDVGDINNDRRDDIAVSSFPYQGDRNASRVSIYRGSKDFNGVVDIVIEEPKNDILLGSNVLLDDLNADRKDEIVIGAPGIGNPKSIEEGEVYIVDSNYYEGEFRLSAKNKDVTSIIHGENSDDWFGYSIETLDINGDGYKDLAIGSRYSDSSNSINDGKVFILFGDNSPFGEIKDEAIGNFVNRGDFISFVIKKFDLKNTKAGQIQDCYDYREFCFFNFSAMSSYDDIQLEPEIILYPDILPGDKYYDDVTMGTMLGLINGYLSEDNSPYHPENNITRIQALKVVLGAADLVPPKYRFELIDILGSLENLHNQPSYFVDVDPRISYMWWYPRYVNFAVEKGILNDGELFRPDDYITWEELDSFVKGTLSYLNSVDEEA